jgi:hypothetical protein
LDHAPDLSAVQHPGFTFSWRDLILIGGGLFLVWKGTAEIHHRLEGVADEPTGPVRHPSLTSTVAQIVALDVVFSLDSVITAVGMASNLVIMMTAIIIAVLLMLMASGPLSRFVNAHPTVKMLALSFLLMIGMMLVADGFRAHVPRGYVYAAMGFSSLVEGLNLLAARRPRRRAGVSRTGGTRQESIMSPEVERDVPLIEGPIAVRRRALLLINPHSRRGAGSTDRVEASLREAGLAFQSVSETTDLAASIRRHAKDVDLVVIGGGDGSLNAVVPALLETGLPLGVIPLGTANERPNPRHSNERQAGHVIADGWTKLVDVGEANKQPFLNVASVGLGVDLTRAALTRFKAAMGHFGLRDRRPARIAAAASVHGVH